MSACISAPAAQPAYAVPAKGPPGAPNQPYVYAVQHPPAPQIGWERQEPTRPSEARRSQRRYSEFSYEAQLAARRERQRDRNRQIASQARGPARTVLETAMRLIEQGRAIKGSCYDYVDAVFKAAGHDDWRRRETVYRKPKKGPYVNLDLVEPGDWLWVVKSSRGAPIRTHSVLFVAWEDRRRGLAYVVDHPGQGRAVSGRYRTYDVSRTYNITRPSETRTGRKSRAKKKRKKRRKRRTASLRR